MVEVRGEGDQESVFIVERTKESSEESGKQTIPEANIQTGIQMVQKEEGNTEIMLGNVGFLYERLISNLNFLKNQLVAKEAFFRDEIMFLRKQLREALAKKVDTSAYLSSGTVAANADESPVKEDPTNPKP